MHKPKLPHERLVFFRKELGISPKELAPLRPYAETLATQSATMAESLYSDMGKMAQTKIILDHETSPTRLKSNWKDWFTMLWKRPCEDALLASLWHSGLRHVSHGVDHRFITLAYSRVRSFSHEAIRELVQPEDREAVHILADKLFDLCILVESDAYITAQAHCSNDVMMGIAHQLRNPLTVIGGMANRLLKVNGEAPEISSSVEAVLGEAKRMERMMQDLVAYIEVLRNEPAFESISLKSCVEQALEKLRSRHKGEFEVSLGIDASEGRDRIQADPEMVRSLLYYILQNALEAQEQAGAEEAHPPSLTIDSGPSVPLGEDDDTGQSNHFVTLEICNPGPLPTEGELEDLFQPFHSTKPFGTGLGLPIARLSAHKNFGTVQLRPWGGKGVCCSVTLVRSGHVHDSGLFFSSPEKA